MTIKKNQTVLIIAGKDKGKRGKILSVSKKHHKVRVEGINIIKKHVKPGRMKTLPQGGILEKEAPIHISNVKESE